jgi:hypothetical protein
MDQRHDWVKYRTANGGYTLSITPARMRRNSKVVAVCTAATGALL